MDYLHKFKIDDKVCVAQNPDMVQKGIAGMRGYIYTCWPGEDGLQKCRVCLSNQQVITLTSDHLIQVTQ